MELVVPKAAHRTEKSRPHCTCFLLPARVVNMVTIILSWRPPVRSTRGQREWNGLGMKKLELRGIRAVGRTGL